MSGFGKPWTQKEYDEFIGSQNRTAHPSPDMEHRDKAESGKANAAKKADALHRGRCFIRFINYRTRLADYDNLCGKYVQDSLVTNRIIHDDNPSIVSRSPEHIQIKLGENNSGSAQ
jgi:hypothetical protein